MMIPSGKPIWTNMDFMGYETIFTGFALSRGGGAALMANWASKLRHKDGNLGFERMAPCGDTNKHNRSPCLRH